MEMIFFVYSTGKQIVNGKNFSISLSRGDLCEEDLRRHIFKTKLSLVSPLYIDNSILFLGFDGEDRVWTSSFESFFGRQEDPGQVTSQAVKTMKEGLQSVTKNMKTKFVSSFVKVIPAYNPSGI